MKRNTNSAPRHDPAHFTVFGVQRSGNVLLAELLRAQESIETGDAWLDPLLKVAQAADLHLNQPLNTNQRQYVLTTCRKLLRHYPSVERALESEHENSFSTVAELIDLLYSRYSTSSITHVGTRIHGPVATLPELLESSTVRLIILIRDVRDVVLSEIHRGRLDIDHYVREWRQTARFAHKNRTHPNLLVLRFESLVQEPQAQASLLSQFLQTNVDFSPATLSKVRWPIKHSSFAPLPQSLSLAAVERWRTCTTHEAVRYAEVASRKELMDWGYEHTTTIPAISAWRCKRRSALYNTATSARDFLRHQIKRRLFPPLTG